MSGLRERLRKALRWMRHRERQARLEAEAQDLSPEGSAERQAICEREARSFRECADRLAAELAAQQPEAPAAGELPAGWEAVERAVREALPCVGTDFKTKCRGGFHVPGCPALRVPAVLSALRSVELVSAARAAKLEAALLRLSEDTDDCCAGWEHANRVYPTGGPEPSHGRHHDHDCPFAVLAAPPSDRWAALMALLGWLEHAPDAGVNARHRRVIRAEASRRLREALGLSEPGSG